jgi:hypothetical protein
VDLVVAILVEEDLRVTGETQFIKELELVLNAQLKSVIAYGFDRPKIWVLCEQLKASQLNDLSDIAKWSQKTLQLTPVFMTQDEFQGSNDIFALDYFEMKATGRCLLGEDIIQELQIDTITLRTLCELELTEKLVYLRQLYLLNRDDPKRLNDALQHALPHFYRILRGIVFLKTSEQTLSIQQVFDVLKTSLPSFDSTPFILLKNPRLINIPHQYQGLLEQIATILHHVDQL